MKKYLLGIAALLASGLLAGCKEDDNKGYMIWDFVNPDISLMVINPLGDNYLDPEYEHNILDRPIKVEYNGKIYRLGEDLMQETRATAVYWYGLRVGKYVGYVGDRGTPALLFGQFQTSSGEYGYHGEKFTVDWGDGRTTSEVKFDLYVTYNHDGTEATVHQKLWVDGDLVNENGLAATATVSPALLDRSSGSAHSDGQTIVWKSAPATE